MGNAPEADVELDRTHRADFELARRTCAGDPAAVDQFVDRMSCVRRFLVHRNNRAGHPLAPDELEEVVQDTLFAIWRKLGEYQGRGTLESWAYRFSFLELLASMRRFDRHPTPFDDVEGGIHEPEAPHEPSPLEFEHMYIALDRLGPPGADIIRLKVFDQMTFEEIARGLGESPNTIKTRFYRGIAKLRGVLSPRIDERRVTS